MAKQDTIAPEPTSREPDAENQEATAKKSDDANHEPAAVKPNAVKPGDRPVPKPGRENAGKPWSKEDDALLMEAYAAGTSVYHMSKSFKRSTYTIEAWLEKLESGQSGTKKRAYRIVNASGALDAGLPGNPVEPKAL